jgi:hypothetical protein
VVGKAAGCYEGKRKYGPYHKIEVIRDGKQKVYIVHKDKVSQVITLYDNRNKFLNAESKIKSINEEIYKVTKEIKK